MTFDARLLSGVGVMVAVSEAGGFGRAGEALGLTPSGVSRAVARLEARLGVRLFERGPRSVTLTEAGQRFLGDVAPLLQGVEEAVETAAGEVSNVRGRLRLDLDPWFARIVLAPRLADLLAAYPALEVSITVSNHAPEAPGVSSDVAVRFGPPRGAAPIARKLLETRVLTVASPAYLAQRGTPQSPADISRHEVILFRDPASGRPFPWEFHRRGHVAAVDVKGRVVLDDPSTALAACEAGAGLFQSFALGIEDRLAAGRLVQVLPDWADESYLLFAYYASSRQLPAKLRAFIDFATTISA
jgi:DNA-binding transcriptional LysR family regulator